jgi:hypothetical protein
MSLVVDLATYIAASSSLVIDTDLFIGNEVEDTPSGSIIIREIPGSLENWSGLEERMIQILALDPGYINAETLILIPYNLLAEKAGFTSLAGIFFVEVLSMPGVVARDPRGNYVFGANFVVRK